jgi:hypothetical protein
MEDNKVGGAERLMLRVRIRERAGERPKGRG